MLDHIGNLASELARVGRELAEATAWRESVNAKLDYLVIEILDGCAQDSMVSSNPILAAVETIKALRDKNKHLVERLQAKDYDPPEWSTHKADA